MTNFKNIYTSQLLKRIVKSESFKIDVGSGNRLSPIYSDLNAAANTKFLHLINQYQLSLGRKISTEPGRISLEEMDNVTGNISTFSSSILSSVIKMTEDFNKNTDKYIKICKRLLYKNIENNNKLSELLDYSCKQIDIVQDSDRGKTTSFNIGNFIILPFCLNSAKLYDDFAVLNAQSSETINFTNSGDILSLPLRTPLLTKYISSSGSQKDTVYISGSISKSISNLFYTKSYGPIEKTKVDLFLSGTLIFSSTINDSEAIFNYKSTEIDSFKIELTLSNYNKNKQVSVQTDSILIFGDLKFSNEAVFETKLSSIQNYLNISKLNINAVDYNTNSLSYFDKYASITFNSNAKMFYKLDQDVSANMPSLKLTSTESFLANNTAINNAITISSRVLLNKSTISKMFYRMNIDNFVNYKNARILIGTNDAYAKAGVVLSNQDGNLYENWTKLDPSNPSKDGNTYRTMLLNHEDNIFIDIGLLKIKVNGVTKTGSFKIPVGISLIDVHESYFDKTMGGSADPTSNNVITDGSFISSDKLFPNNFIYKLAGLPQYDINSNIIEDQVVTNITGVSVVQCDSPFFPLSVRVEGNNLQTYKLHLGNSPLMEGTYTVEPNSGKIRINSATGSDSVTISYIKASLNIRPCGILFNRLGRYIDYKSINNMMAVLGAFDNTFFSSYEYEGQRALLIPSIDKIYHSKILYNKNETSALAAIKLVLKTEDSDITPAIKNVFIQGVE